MLSQLISGFRGGVCVEFMQEKQLKIDLNIHFNAICSLKMHILISWLHSEMCCPSAHLEKSINN